jgi:hypothetical protein
MVTYEMLLCHDTESEAEFTDPQKSHNLHGIKKHIIMLASVSINCCSIKVAIEILFLRISKFDS